MLGHVTACQCMMVRLAQMDDDGKLEDHDGCPLSGASGHP
jgi:hypothetical protein